MSKTLIALCCALVIAAPLWADPKVADIAPIKLTERVYVIEGPRALPAPENGGFTNNPVIVLTDQGAVVMDPGGSLEAGRMVLRQVEKLTKKPVIALFNSHHHADHWMGNDAFVRQYPDLPIYADGQMIEIFKGGEGQSWYERFQNLGDGSFKETRLVGPNRPLKPGQSVELGGLTFKTFHPDHAHTKGDLMVQVVEEGALFLSDICPGKGLIRMDDGSFYGARDAMEASLGFSARVMIPGHGHAGDEEVAQGCYSYYADLVRIVIDRFNAGEDQLTMRPAVMETMRPYAGWHGFEDNIGKHLSLTYLEVEMREF